jgi:hypothetical protein
MLITQEIFEAFLKCRTKSHLIGHGVTIEGAAADLPMPPPPPYPAFRTATTFGE